VHVHINKKQIDQVFGKCTVVLVQMTVNNGTTTETFVVEGFTENTRFQFSLTAAATTADKTDTTSDTSTVAP
jgi:hypothetical protein